MRSSFATFCSLALACLIAPTVRAQNSLTLSSSASTGPRFLSLGPAVVPDGSLVRVGTIVPLPGLFEPMDSLMQRFVEFASTTMGTGTGNPNLQNVGRLNRTVAGSENVAWAVAGYPICLIVYNSASAFNTSQIGVFSSETTFPFPGGFGFNVGVSTFRQGYGGAAVTLAQNGTGLVTEFTLAGGTILSPLELWRFSYFGYIINDGDAADTADPDRDGFSNWMEFVVGTDPTRAASVVQLGMSLPSATQANFRITPVRYGVRYIIQRAGPGLTSWTDATTATFPAAAAQGTVPLPVSGPRAFFRLKLEIPP